MIRESVLAPDFERCINTRVRNARAGNLNEIFQRGSVAGQHYLASEIKGAEQAWMKILLLYGSQPYRVS